MGGKRHKQATASQISELRGRFSALEASDGSVLRYRRFLSDRVLHRFITARNGNVDLALRMLLSHLKWRESYGIDTILDEDLSSAGLGKEFFWCGFDRAGRPCLVFRASEHSKSDPKGGPTVEEKVRRYCQLLEQGFRDYAPAFNFCLLVDCRGAGTNCVDRKLLKVATPILEDNFPETQHATYIVPCSRFVMMAWKAISNFVDPGTAEKIRLVSGFDDPALEEAFTPETLKAIFALDPSKAPPQPHVAPDPLSLSPPPPMQPPGVCSENLRFISSSSMVISEAASRLSAESLTPASKPHLSKKERSPVEESRQGAENIFPPEDDGDYQGERGEENRPHPCPSVVTAVYGSLSTTGRGSPALPSTCGSSVHRKPGDTNHNAASPSLSGSSAYSRFRYSDAAQESSKEPLFSPSPGSSAVTPGVGGPREAVIPPPTVGPSVGMSSPPLPPSPSSAYPPPSPAGSSDGDLVPVPLDGNSVFDGRYTTDKIGAGNGNGNGGTNRVVDVRECFDQDQQKNSSSAGSSGSGPKSMATAQTVGATPEEKPASVAGATPEPSDPIKVLPREEDFVYIVKEKVFAGDEEARRESGVMVMVNGGQYSTHSASVGEAREVSASTEWKEKTGYLYKRRDTFKGRFAHRQRYAILRFPPPATAAAMASARHGADAVASATTATPPPMPSAPTLTLLKSGQSGTEKVVSLEGAEVTLGTAMSGDLFPFVVSFPTHPRAPAPALPAPSHPRRRRGGADAKPRESRRNTEDFVFTGVMDSWSSGGVGGRPRASVGGAMRQVRGGSDQAHSSSGSDNLNNPSTMIDVTGRGLGGVSRGKEARRKGLRRGKGDVLSPLVPAPVSRKVLHLACGTQEQTLEWARWIADAAALHEAALEAASSVNEGGGVERIAHPASGSYYLGHPVAQAGADLSQEHHHQPSAALPGRGSSSFYRIRYKEALDALAAVEEYSPGVRNSGAFSRDALVSGVKALGDGGEGRKGAGDGDGEKGSSGERKTLVNDFDRYRRPTVAGRLAHGARGLSGSSSSSTNGGLHKKRTSSASSFYASAPPVGVGVGVLRGLGEVGESLMAMRDTEISRLRRSYARAELSRWEMRRCLRALAVQLRDGEDKTGALLDDQEAARRDLSAKEAELARKEASMEETRAREAEEARSKEALVSNLRVENQALQAALERQRLEFLEERELLDMQRQEFEAASASVMSSDNNKVFDGYGEGRSSSKMPQASKAGSAALPRPRRTPTRNALQRHSVGATAVMPPNGIRANSPWGRLSMGSHDRRSHSPVVRESANNSEGIGSRFHDEEGFVEEFQGVEGKMIGRNGRPWILNGDQEWRGAARPPLEVLAHLLDGLDEVRTLKLPQGVEVSTSESFVKWRRGTEELQRVPALEVVDLPGEERFTEGCLKLLRFHAAVVLGKKPDQLTGKEESRMAYAVGNGVYTIARLLSHLRALTAGVPTE